MKRLTFIMLITLFFPVIGLALDAFPGAVGEGRNSVGGRGGTVIKVTNLNDSGTGSLREALLTTGARYIIFDVSGNISLTTTLTVVSPYVTIAGETSPGGIAVSGKQFNIATHDVIIRHMRFRHGGYNYEQGNNSDGDSFSFWGAEWNGGVPIYNIIVDHCSFTWGTDETLSVTGGCENVTIQSCLVAGGLWYVKDSGKHSKGLMISGKYYHDTELSVYKTYIAHNEDRNPWMYNPVADGTLMEVDYVNNVTFNWDSNLRPQTSGDAKVNWIANYIKEGPNSARIDFVLMGTNSVDETSPKEAIIYTLGNIGTGRDPEDAEWAVSRFYTQTTLSTEWQSSTRFVMDNPLLYSTMTATLAQAIVSDAGATVPIRDSVDTAYVNSFATNTGLMEDDYPSSVKAFPGDYPTYISETVLTDSNSNGIADTWETSTFGGLVSATDDADLDGYDNLEEYLHYLAGSSGGGGGSATFGNATINSITWE